MAYYGNARNAPAPPGPQPVQPTGKPPKPIGQEPPVVQPPPFNPWNNLWGHNFWGRNFANNNNVWGQMTPWNDQWAGTMWDKSMGKHGFGGWLGRGLCGANWGMGLGGMLGGPLGAWMGNRLGRGMSGSQIWDQTLGKSGLAGGIGDWSNNMFNSNYQGSWFNPMENWTFQKNPLANSWDNTAGKFGKKVGNWFNKIF